VMAAAFIWLFLFFLNICSMKTETTRNTVELDFNY
jgi:hypothetical protein